MSNYMQSMYKLHKKNISFCSFEKIKCRNISWDDLMDLSIQTNAEEKFQPISNDVISIYILTLFMYSKRFMCFSLFVFKLSFNPFKPEFTIVILIHYKPRIAAAILDL